MGPTEFLTNLWGEDPPGKLVVWTLEHRISHWFDNQKRTIADIERHLPLSIKDDVYTAMLAVPADHPEEKDKRYTKEDTLAAMACLWADIDYYDPVHKKRDRLPPDQAAALDLLHQLPFQPTIVNNSGHGLQAFWIWQTPWVFRDADDQALAADLAFWWHSKIKDACQARDWTTDSVFDITRVMRLPGYRNWKDPGNPAAVRTILENGPRTALRDAIAQAEEAAAQEAAARPPQTPRTTRWPSAEAAEPNSAHTQDDAFNVPDHPRWPYTMKADAQPPDHKLQTLLETSAKFAATWNMTRDDMTADNSPSAYDLSLANQAVLAGLTNQDTIDLLIAFRAKHGLPLKLRDTYFRPTLKRARTSRGEQRRELNDRLRQRAAARSDEPREPSQLTAWIDQYLEDRWLLNTDLPEEIQPYLDQDAVHIHTADFHAWLKAEAASAADTEIIDLQLQAAGFHADLDTGTFAVPDD